MSTNNKILYKAYSLSLVIQATYYLLTEIRIKVALDCLIVLDYIDFVCRGLGKLIKLKARCSTYV